eukprot:c29099_g2_i1 orf=1378-2988(-)
MRRKDDVIRRLRELKTGWKRRKRKMDRLLVAKSKEIRLNFEVGKKAFAKVGLRSLMHTMPIAFKVFTTAPMKYGVRPHVSIIPPLGEACFEVVMFSQQRFPESIPFSCDMLFVKSVPCPTGRASDKELNHLFCAVKSPVFTDASLPVVFTGGEILRYLATFECLESLKSVEEVLKDVNVDDEDKQGRTALSLAAARGNYWMVNVFLEAGANVSAKDRLGLTPLLEAASGGCLDIVKILLRAGADIDARNASGWAALHFAASLGRLEVLKFLLDEGADKHAMDGHGRTPLHVAVASRHLKALRMLLQSGVDTDKRCHDGWTALHYAAADGNLDAVELLLEHGANANIRNNQRKIPIGLALENGQSALLDVLQLQKLLQKAAREGNVTEVTSYLSLDASPNGRDQYGWTALHSASFKGRLESAKVLLKHQADVNCKDQDGYTPLHCAVEAGHKEIVQCLLQHGADISARSNKGVTPLSLAVTMRYLGIERILEESVSFKDLERKHIVRKSEMEDFDLPSPSTTQSVTTVFPPVCTACC